MYNRNPGSFLFTILISLILLASATVAFASELAVNDGVIDWTGHGSENLPCIYGGHWVLAPAFGIDSAVLTVNGNDYTMTQKGQGSWSADSSGALDSGLSAYVTYTGPGDDNNSLQLSHCTEGEDPTPTPTEDPPTPTPTEDSPTATPTENPPTNTPTGTPPTPTSTPTGPTPTPTEYDPTATPTKSDPTVTPKPPVPAIGDNNEVYSGELLGSFSVDGRSFGLYQGVNAKDDTLELPSAIRGGSLYQNGIWVHREWNSGWLVINLGSTIQITLNDGSISTYTVTDIFTQSYGTYPQTDQLYIASCYSDGYGEWVGVMVYILE